MERMLAPLFLLFLLLALFSESLQSELRLLFERKPQLLFLAPLGLTLLFCITAGYHQCLSWQLALLIVAYTFFPTALSYFFPAGRNRKRLDASWIDLCVILVLWLPLELSFGANLIPRRVQGVMHATAYGVAISLGVMLFLLWRGWAGMKYKISKSSVDLGNIFLGYLAAASTLIPLGLWIGFLPAAHRPFLSWPQVVARFLIIFFGTALPEEILFRSLIQNWFTERLRASWTAVALGALIFGAAHLNNGPAALPNWRYMAIATIAGLIFGTVFRRSQSVLASVTVHAGVNLTKHLFF